MNIQPFFDPGTSTITYLVSCPETLHAAVIDPVLDFDAKSGTTATRSVDQLIAEVRAKGLKVQWILETHAHADHLSAAAHIKAELGGAIGIGEHIREVQAIFKKIYNLERTFLPDGSQFDHLFVDGESFSIGKLQGRAIHVPGHTPADMAYLIDGVLFVGDTLFMPDVGTARADFPGGDAAQLYQSIKKLLALPPGTPIYVCHDYPPADRKAGWVTSVAQQRQSNIHVRDGITQEEFVRMRSERDATLDVPALLLPSVQVNVRGGRLPDPEANGVAYLRIPINALPKKF